MRTLISLGIAAAILSAGVGLAGPAAAQPDPTDEVCGAFNLGVPPEQIAERLGRNDARYNYWRSVQSTMWPIIEGQCG